MRHFFCITVDKREPSTVLPFSRRIINEGLSVGSVFSGFPPVPEGTLPSAGLKGLALEERGDISPLSWEGHVGRKQMYHS